MKPAIRPILTLSLFAALSAFGADDPPVGAPQADTMEPRSGKAGALLRVQGKSLGKSTVDEVYLTDHRFDLKVKVLEQTETHLTIRIPPFVKPGRLQLLFLTGGKNPLFLEQPFYVQIEDGEEAPLPAPVEVTKAKPAKTVEIASVGAKIPVPPAPAPAPMTSALLPKKSEPVAEPVAAKSEPVVAEKKPVEVAKVIPAPVAPVPVQSPVPSQLQQQPVPTQQQATPVAPQQPAAPGAAAGNPDVEVVPAQVLRRTRVAYPSTASATKVEGIVELLATVGADGRVKAVKIVKGNPFLASAAMTSVRDWLYEPARLNGRPVESQVNVVLNFKRP